MSAEKASNQPGERGLVVGDSPTTIPLLEELRQAEAALRESEARFRGTFENAAIGIVHEDLDGRFLLLNRTFCDIVGYEHAELLGKRWQDITHPDDLSVGEEHYRRLASGEVQRFSLEKRYVRPDRSLVWVEVTVSLQRDEAGSPAYAIAIVEDISDRKRLQEALQRSKTRLELSVRGSNIRIWDIDMPDGNLQDSLIYVGDYRHRFSTFLSRVHPDDLEGLMRAVHASCSGETKGSHPSSACVTRKKVPIVGCSRAAVSCSTPRANRSASWAATPTSPTSSRPRRRCGPASSGSGCSWTTPPTRSSCTTSRAACWT